MTAGHGSDSGVSNRGSLPRRQQQRKTGLSNGGLGPRAATRRKKEGKQQSGQQQDEKEEKGLGPIAATVVKRGSAPGTQQKEKGSHGWEALDVQKGLGPMTTKEEGFPQSGGGTRPHGSKERKKRGS